MAATSESDPESVALSRALSDLRWRSEAPGIDADALLRRIATYEDYWLAVVDGAVIDAPDAHGRSLAPVFTSQTALNRFVLALPEDGAPTSVLRVNGRELFTWLANQGFDGVIFNPAGPGEPIAFAAGFAALVLRVAESPERQSPAADFDALIQAAYPGAGPGSDDARDALWRALFDLGKWRFLVHPDDSGEPRPLVLEQDEKVCAFAFTDGAHARATARINELMDPSGNVYTLALEPHEAIEWSLSPENPVEVIHFNFAGPGFAVTAANLKTLWRRYHSDAD